jgi:hypothetical protein
MECGSALTVSPDDDRGSRRGGAAPGTRLNRADMDEEAMSKKTLLMKAADELLRKANCDALTGERKDREYEMKTRAASKRARRLMRLKEREFGKLGAASRVRRIEPEGACMKQTPQQIGRQSAVRSECRE